MSVKSTEMETMLKGQLNLNQMIQVVLHVKMQVVVGDDDDD